MIDAPKCGECLREVAFEMEKAVKAGDLDAAERHITELEAQFGRLNQVMTKEHSVRRCNTL
jgi:hypothetical protein